MNIYIRSREGGDVIETMTVSTEAEAERVFREASSRVGDGLNINPADKYNWRDQYIDASEVWTDPRHALED